MMLNSSRLSTAFSRALIVVAAWVFLVTACASSADVAVSDQVGSDQTSSEFGAADANAADANAAEDATPTPASEPPTVAPTSAPVPLSAVTLVPTTAEALDRVDLVGAAGDLSAMTFIDGERVELPIVTDGDGAYFIAPLIDLAESEEAVISVELTDGVEVAPAIELTMTGLPAAPGAAAELLNQLRDDVDQLAEVLGVSGAEVAAPVSTEVSPELILITALELLIDDGTENDLTTVLGGDGDLSEAEQDRIDAVVAKLIEADVEGVGGESVDPDAGRSDATSSVVPTPTPSRQSAVGKPSGPTPLQLGSDTRDHRARQGGSCIPGPAISTPEMLVDALQRGLAAQRADTGIAGGVRRDIANAFSVGGALPGVAGKLSGGASYVIGFSALKDRAVAGILPTSLDQLNATVDRTDFTEDFVLFGSWSDVQLVASSTGTGVLGDLVSLAAGGVSTIGGELSVSTTILSNAGADLLNSSSLASYCPMTWVVDVESGPYVTARATFDTLDIDQRGRTFEPTMIGRDQLVLETNPQIFRGVNASQSFPITTEEMDVILSPREIMVQNPGEIVGIDIRFEESETLRSFWTPGAGEFIVPGAEWEGEAGRSLQTPTDEAAYPFRVDVRVDPITGLHRPAASFPPPLAADTVQISLAELVIEPSEALVRPGETVQYTAFDRNGTIVEVDWSATGGSIDGSGLFTAGEDTGTFAVTAELASSPNVRASVPVEIADVDCAVGVWRVRFAEFMQQIAATVPEAQGVAVNVIGGEYLIEIRDDGTYTGFRNNLQLELASPLGVVVMTIDSEDPGEWIATDDTITFNDFGGEATVTITLNGQQLPFGSTQTVETEAISGSGPFECEPGVQISTTAEGITSISDYVGPVPTE